MGKYLYDFNMISYVVVEVIIIDNVVIFSGI